MKISTLYPSQCQLGESPLWHQSRKSVFWVDILESVLYEYHFQTKSIYTWIIASNVSLVIAGEDNQLILAVKGGLLNFDLKTGDVSWLAHLDENIENNRCNDGVRDQMGRIWVGTMDRHCKENAGSLYMLDSSWKPKKMMSDLTIPNGLVWSLDHERMYFIDTPTQMVKSYLYNQETGDIQFERTAVRIPKELGMPDGMTIDAKGMLWVALYGGAAVSRWNPVNGELLQVLKMPALNITNCTFAGENMDMMVVTSARENLSGQQLNDYPESGNVFIIEGLFDH
jgi:sugar lactone lactonase YvrE